MANVVRIIVDAVNHTNRVFREVSREAGRIVNNIAQGFARGTQKLFSVFEDGIGGALKSALSTPYVGPILIAALAAAVEFAAPVIAALIASALTLGLGAALVGVGALILMHNKKVKDGLTKDFKEAGKTMEKAFQPLIPVLEHVGDVVKKLAKFFEPVIEKAMKLAAPHLNKFVDNLGQSFEKLAPAIGPLMDAFDKMLDDLGPKLPGMVKDISDSLIKMFDAVGKHPEVFTKSLELTIDIIALVIDALAELTKFVGWNVKGWKNMWKEVEKIWDGAKDAFSSVGDFFSGVWDKIVEGANKVKDAVKDVGKWIKGLKGKTVKIAQSGASTVVGWVKSVIGWIRRFVGKTVHIGQSGASSVIGWVKSVIGWIRRFVGKTVHVGVSGVSGAIGAVRSLMGWIGNLVGKTVHIGVDIAGAAKHLLGFAHGGVVGAAGGGPRSNMVMVGEQGRELVKLPAGSTVVPHGQTESMMGQGGGTITVQLEWVGNRGGDELMKFIRENVRAKAGTGSGNVQKALG